MKDLCNGYIVSVWDDKNVLEIDGSDGYTTVCRYLIPWSIYLKIMKMVKWALCMFCCNEKTQCLFTIKFSEALEFYYYKV